MVGSEMLAFISEILRKKRINFTRIESIFSDSTFGLLHKPISRFVVHTEGKPIKLAVKEVSLTESPESLFRMLYSECSNEPIHLDWFDRHCDYLSMKDMPNREYNFYVDIQPRVSEFTPHLWYAYKNQSSLYIIMDDLSDYTNIDKIDFPEAWEFSYLARAISDLALVHMRLYGSLSPKEDYIYDNVRPFLHEFHSVVSLNSGINLSEFIFNKGNHFIKKIDQYEAILREESVVIHNDFNIRNICFSPKTNYLQIYDWEFITIGNPMMDIVDFLLSISPAFINARDISKLLSIYCDVQKRITLSAAIEMLNISAMKFAATRMNMYLLCYSKAKYKYIERMYQNLYNILSIFE